MTRYFHYYEVDNKLIDTLTKLQLTLLQSRQLKKPCNSDNYHKVTNMSAYDPNVLPHLLLVHLKVLAEETKINHFIRHVDIS